MSASSTHVFSISGHPVKITVIGSLTDPAQPVSELHVDTGGDPSSLISGMMRSFAQAVTLSLQYGVPLRLLVDKLRGTSFHPCGSTSNADLPVATSIIDYIFRWMEERYLRDTEEWSAGKIRVP